MTDIDEEELAYLCEDFEEDVVEDILLNAGLDAPKHGSHEVVEGFVEETEHAAQSNDSPVSECISHYHPTALGQGHNQAQPTQSGDTFGLNLGQFLFLAFIGVPLPVALLFMILF